MSGIEIAGLVLGAVPIVIEALKYYSEARGFVDRYRTKNALITLLIQDLKYDRLIIDEQVRLVFGGSGIIVSESEFQTGQAVRRLQDSSQNHAILEYLGEEKFGIFITQLKRCQDALTEILSQFQNLIPETLLLSAPNEDQSETLRRLILANERSPKPWKLSRKRLKFSYSKPELDRRMAQLWEAIQRLKDLQSPPPFVFANTVLGEVNSRTIQSLAKSFESVRREASRLYYALTTTLVSSCHQSHDVHLFLEERTDALRRQKAFKPAFNVTLFGFSANESADVCHQCEVKLSGIEATVSEHGNPSESPHVRFVAQPILLEKKAVVELCVCLRDAAAKGQALDLLLSQQGALYCLESDGVTDLQHRTSPEQCISLEEAILQANRSAQVARRWSLRQRMTLALRLACAIPQLSRTHWLPSDCKSSSIYFCRPGVDSPATHPPFEADFPFVRKTRLPHASNEEPTPWAHSLILDLGIVLLELWSMERFVDWCVGAKHSADVRVPCDERRQAADAWLVELEPSMLPNYKRAVSRCIEMSGRMSNSFDVEDFREDFCEAVIKPLWENCKLWLR